MKRNTLPALLIAPMLFVATHACGQNATLDQQQAVINTQAQITLAIGGGPGGQRLAQVVTAGLTGSLTEIRLAVGCSNQDRLTAEIQGVSSDKPNGVVLSTNTTSMGGYATPPTFKSITLGNPINLHTGDRYAIVLRTPSATETCSAYPGPVGNPYAGGDAFYDSPPNPPGQWIPLATSAPTIYGADLPFQSFVVVAPVTTTPIPTLSEWGMLMLVLLLAMATLYHFRNRE